MSVTRWDVLVDGEPVTHRRLYEFGIRALHVDEARELDREWTDRVCRALDWARVNYEVRESPGR